MADDTRTRPILMAGIAVASVVVIATGLLVWRALTADAPAEVALGSLPPVTTDQPAASPDDTGDAPVPTSFDGSWTIDAQTGTLDDATSTFAGYRIDEELGGIGANTAVGRTQSVQGSMTIA